MLSRFSARLPRRLLYSRKALAIPLTYLILLASMVTVASITYTFAMIKLGNHNSLLRVSVAEQNIEVLDEAVRSVLWGFSSSRTVHMSDCGSIFQTSPTARNLRINLADEDSFNKLVFNSSIGRVLYELEPSSISNDNHYLIGDTVAITNKSSSPMTQMYIVVGENSKELVLSYRPRAIATVTDDSIGRPENLIRVCIINLNSSLNLILREAFYLKVTCLQTRALVNQYEFNQSVLSLSLKADLDGASHTVRLPLSSSEEGATVYLEIVICSIKIERVGG